MSASALLIAALTFLSGQATVALAAEPAGQQNGHGASTPTRITKTAAEMEREALSEKELSTRKFVMRRDMQVIRNRYFNGVRAEGVRAAGMERLRELAKDPLSLPIMLDVFQGEPDKLRVQIVDMIASLETDATDATIAWIAMTEQNAPMKRAAANHVEQRTAQRKGDVPIGVQSVIAAGLESADNDRAAAAANMALGLRLYEAIPSMIQAQVRPSNAGEPGAGALAQIVVATQRAFVSDLTPVVGQGAVAFDPTVSVVTDGVVLRVMDAYVITYRTYVNSSLVGLAKQLRPNTNFAAMGYDQAKWAQWYKDEGEAAIAAARIEATPKQDGAAAPSPATPPTPPAPPAPPAPPTPATPLTPAATPAPATPAAPATPKSPKPPAPTGKGPTITIG